MSSHLLDVRSGFRALSKDPTSALIAVITLALGIGLCTNAFSVVYGVFLRGLGIPEADRVRVVMRTNPSRDIDFMPVTQHDFFDWRERQTSFEGLASYSGGNDMNLSDSLGPERFEGSSVSANMFSLLRVRPVLGNDFHPDDELPGAPLKVLLAHGLWTSRYQSNPAIVGAPVKVNGEAATVVGVMPEGFMFPADRLLWVVQRDQRAGTPNRQGGVSFQVAGRLRDGITWERAQSEMSAIAAGIAREFPQTNEGVDVVFRTFVEDDTGPELIAVFGGMQVATIFVLLIACANVANLLLARATLRTRDAAVRTAIGGSPLRVVLPYFSETAILAVCGAILGAGIAWTGVELFDRATSTVGKPYYMIFAMDAPVVAFVIGMAVFSTLAAGIAPALQILRTNVNSTLKDESRGTSGARGGRVSRVLVVAQVALSCALLIGAGLMVKSLARLSNYEFSFATSDVLTARVSLLDATYPDAARRREFWRTLLERLEGMPGAAAATLTTNLPGGRSGGAVMIEGEAYATDEEYPDAGSVLVSPGFFRTFDVPLVQGREFNEMDRAGALPVAIINRDFADRYFPGTDPIGRRIRPGGADSPAAWHTIVGVAPSLMVRGLEPEDENAAQYYVPFAQRAPGDVYIAVRTAGGDPLTLASGVRGIVRALDPDQPIFDAYSMLGYIERETWFFRVFGTLFIVFGAAALFMASVGLYGVLAFSVSRRVREMGIRMALGASGRDVIRMILRQGAMQTAIGLTIGLGLAAAIAGPLQIIMFEIQPRDPVVFGSIALVILSVGLAASWVPARRATRVDPMIALRYE